MNKENMRPTFEKTKSARKTSVKMGTKYWVKGSMNFVLEVFL